MQKKSMISRRHVLRGAGAALTLPYLESIMSSWALPLPDPAPVPRFGMFYLGMGMNDRQFFPEDTGPGFTTARILRLLEPHRGRFTVLSGTYLVEGGGHRGTYPFATGISMDRRQGISADQLAAEVVGQQTRFPSRQLSVRRGTGFGSQVLGTLSFNWQGVPLSPENDPSAIFRRLFLEASPEQKKTQQVEWRRRRSVRDLVQDDAQRLQKKLWQADRPQLDQYLESVRELEKELNRVVEWSRNSRPHPDLQGIGDYSVSMTPEQSETFPYETCARLMYDLIALAFQTDSTRGGFVCCSRGAARRDVC